jgi:hypothetical protein
MSKHCKGSRRFSYLPDGVTLLPSRIEEFDGSKYLDTLEENNTGSLTACSSIGVGYS